METSDIGLILRIFGSDEDLYKYCDPDYLIEGKKISVKIYKRIQDALKEYPNSYYVTDKINKWFMVWMFAHGGWILYSFGIHPDRRTKENLIDFWREIRKRHDSFTCYLYSNNTRAIDWLKKCGMKENGKIVERQDRIAIKLVLDKYDNGDMV
jgi:ribosomal protein S18 acetylase RimI-like enzyme